MEIFKTVVLLILYSFLLIPSISTVSRRLLPRYDEEQHIRDDVRAVNITNTKNITNTNDTEEVKEDVKEDFEEDFDFCNISCPGGRVRICESMWTCKPINGCMSISIDHVFRTHVIASHNTYRNDVALGKTSLPPGADISVMNYEMHLEYISECYASNCKISYDGCNKTSFEGPIGLNYYKVDTNSMSLTASSVPHIIDQWFGENTKIEANALKNFSAANGNNFTQMVWASTTKVGCALSSDSAGFGYMICSYYPQGNTEGGIMYTAGDPCSACPVCNRRYKGLCGYGKDQPEGKGCFPMLGNNYALQVTGLFLYFLIML